MASTVRAPAARRRGVRRARLRLTTESTSIDGVGDSEKRGRRLEGSEGTGACFRGVGVEVIAERHGHLRQAVTEVALDGAGAEFEGGCNVVNLEVLVVAQHEAGT